MFQIGAALIIGVAVVYSTTANLSPRLVRYPRGEITLSHLARFEGYSGFAGTTSFDEFFPATMQSPIGFNQHLSESQASITNIQLVRYTPTERAFDVTASISTPITLRTFYFPDWQAEIDGFPARAYSHTPLGLLAVDVPAGNHRVVFHSVNTQAQTLGNLLSGASMLALLLLIGLAYRHRAAELPIILTALGIVLLSALIPTTVALTAPAFPIQSMQTQVTPSLEMIGLNIDAAKLDAHEWQVTHARDLLSVSVYWHVLDSVSDKPVFWKLTGNAFKSWSVTEQLPRFGSGFANAWIPNEVVEDHYELALPAAMPAGRYELHVSYGDDRHFVLLTAIELTAGSPPAPPSPNIPRPINAQLGDRIKLLGSDAASVASAGENFPLTLFWRAERNVLDDYILFAQLLDLRGEAPVQHNAQPGIDFTPTSLWIPGRITTERLDLVLPSTLKPGIYTLIAGLYGKPNQPRLPVFTGNGPADEDFVTLGEIRVPMNAQSAEPAHYLNFSLASNIRLLGYDLQTTRAQATLKLYWQAHTKIDADYKVFVHLVDATGQVAAQVDQLPGEGLYPTRIWEPGEKIIDVYDVSLRNLPPGKYTLVAGMYAPETGERLSVGDTGGNELPNRQIQIGSIDVAGQ